jgi:hypothetical protein
MEKINKKMIERKFENICKLTKSSQINGHLAIDYASVYGGYRLVFVENDSYVQWGCFGLSSVEPRKNAKEFYSLLQGIEAGLTELSLI